jgi:hypothetical protein
VKVFSNDMSMEARNYCTKLLIFVSLLWLNVSSFLIHRQSSSPTKFGKTRILANYDGNQQAAEAINSLVQYHEGTWKGKARSFTVIPDTAAGIVQRKSSPEYEVSVRLGLNSDQKISLQETFSWEDHVSSRSLSISDCNMDVDSVDASYSLDTTLPDFPAAISGTNKICQFIIEHCIAASEDRRMRCFCMYGVDQSLQRVVVCDETKNDEQKQASKNDSVFTAADLLEMQSDVDRLVDKLTGASTSVESIDSDFPLSRPEDNILNGIGAGGGDAGKIPPSDDGAQKLALHDISLLELSTGVWLGDAIIRDLPAVASSRIEPGQGFGENSSSQRSIPSEFGDWSVGVQKLAWRWMWNFGEETRQIVDVGKSMGAQLADCMSGSLSGSVCVNESLSRRIAKEDRMVYLDLNNDLVGFVTGPVSIQVPRYLNFDAGAAKTSKPFFSEFCVYQSAEVTEDKIAGEAEVLPALCCSRQSRIYNFEGKLKQGCTSFYTFKRFGSDGELAED